ncbi:unnamed protein product [Cylindrotheca closterium]|uniref:HSF-type DNA-binding domain-containing protein n=1 Tax=Cylindrotheca closterium TaxID=2856 RepID=A0AAD2CYU7_9STRA|nr:unnamed protein product [Cylindrotheca closterium]
MPHHSSQSSARPASEMPSVHSHSLYSPQGIPSEAMRGHTVAHIMRPNNSHGPYSSPPCYHPTGMVTPMKQNSWIHGAPMSRSMPTLETPKSADSLDRSTSTKQDDSTVATLATESDDLEKREQATASALLMVSGKVKMEPRTEISNASTTSTTSNVPLKKRKNLGFLRPKTESVSTSSHDPCHISPVSHSSLESGGRTISKEEGSPERTPASTVRTESYDSKESPVGNLAAAQTLLETSKINSTTEIAPPTHVSVPHFPTVLHQVLADEACAGSVVQWTEEGEAWKVLRWDALRRQVLPKYFADLTDEHGRGSGTIDAFLWHLTAWGFEEKQDGSYRHDFFIRGAQKLCSKMRSSGIPGVIQQGKGILKAVSPLRSDRSMLEVPSLSTSRPQLENTVANHPNKRARYALGGWAQRPQEVVDASGWGRFYPEAQQVGMRHVAGQYISYPMAHPATPYAPPHPQVTRSGRGRMGMSRSAAASPIPSTPIARSAFPVSNRGKGRKGGSVCRSSLPSPVTVPAGRASPLISYEAPDNASEASNAAARTNKRKLPLAQKTVMK